MIGCALVVEKDYFFEIGAFDEGMDVWGGENIEFPIRVSFSTNLLIQFFIKVTGESRG